MRTMRNGKTDAISELNTISLPFFLEYGKKLSVGLAASYWHSFSSQSLVNPFRS